MDRKNAGEKEKEREKLVASMSRAEREGYLKKEKKRDESKKTGERARRALKQRLCKRG